MLSEYDRRTIAEEVSARMAEHQRKVLVNEIAERVMAIIVERFAVAEPVRPVLPLQQAIRYVGRKSRAGFKVWARRWGVSGCGSGRYSRRALDAGMERESNAVYVHGKGAM